MKLTTYLRRLGACTDAIEWAKEYSDLETAWAGCQRGDWMLWLAAKAEMCSRQELVLAACACARLALKHVPAGENRPLKAIETAEAWARGEATLEQVRAAAAAAYAYAAAAAYAYAAAAAYAAAYAAYADAYAAADAAYAAARSATLAQCADIVRTRASERDWSVSMKAKATA